VAVIGIDYTPAYEQGGGIGRLVRQQTAALLQLDTQIHYRLLITGFRPNIQPTLQQAIAPFQIRTTRFTPKTLARIWQRARLPLPVEIFTGRLDLYHATDFVLPPVLPATRTIVTVHDLSFVFTPETAAPKLRRYLSQVVPRSVQRADHVIADSESTKRDLIRLYGVPDKKVSVVLSGVSDHFKRVTDPHKCADVRQRYNLPHKPYLFCVGTVQPRKNYSRVIRSLAALRKRGYDVALVIAGGRGWLEDDMYATIQATELQDHVHLIGFADDADLPALYSEAQCTVFPSLYEGFGFPVLESMACGTPVITSNVSSLPEVAGDAALMVNPVDQEALTHAIQRLLDDAELREHMTQRGYAQVRKFTWAASGKSLYEVYQHTLNS